MNRYDAPRGALILPLLALGLATAGCAPTSETEREPGLGSSPPFDIVAVPLGPDFQSAEVSFLVGDRECGRRILSADEPRWSEQGLCGDSRNRVDTEFVVPIGRCEPGGLYVHRGAAVDARGRTFEVREFWLYAWGADGTLVDSIPIDFEVPVVWGQSASKFWPGDEVALDGAGAWSYSLDLGFRDAAPGCSRNLLLSLSSASAAVEVPRRDIDLAVEVRRDATTPKVQRIRLPDDGSLLSLAVSIDDEWQEIPATPSDDAIEFSLPAPLPGPVRFTFSGMDALRDAGIEAKVAYAPREGRDSAWVSTSAEQEASLRVDERLDATPPPSTESVSLAEALAGAFARVTSSLPAGASLEIAVTADLEAGDVIPVRTPLLRAPPSPFLTGRDESSDCTRDPLPFGCALADSIEASLGFAGAPDREGTLLLGLQFRSNRSDLEQPVLELTEVAIRQAGLSRP